MNISYSINISNAEKYKNKHYYDILRDVFTKHMKLHVKLNKKQNTITVNINQGVAKLVFNTKNASFVTVGGNISKKE